MEASCTVQTLRNSCKFFSKSDKKKLARAISKDQVSDPGPSWPSCLFLGFFFFFFSQGGGGGGGEIWKEREGGYNAGLAY